MLAGEPRTPRPRPPALVRRSNDRTAHSPVLAYIEDGTLFSTPIDDIDISDPVRATAKLLGLHLDSEPEISPTRKAEVSEKSREELANLFLEAEKVIRAREAELAIAANLGKTLLETNEALKNRHEMLLARLPVMQSSPPTPTSQKSFKPGDGDAWTTDEDVPSSSKSVDSIKDDAFRSGHRRRISASPSALQALSETNGELITELTRLRESTEAAQIDGANRLRKLEREISTLRVELEATQKMNVELEEHVNAQRDEGRRRRWEERLNRYRESKDRQQQGQLDCGRTIEAWDSVKAPDAALENGPGLESTSPLRSRGESVSANEYTLVAQLLDKVEELQTANREIRARNQATHEQFARAERNALEIKRVYDTICEEMGADADGEMSDPGDKRTFRHRSSRNSLRSPNAARSSSARSLTPRSSVKSLRAKHSGDESLSLTVTKPKAARALGNRRMFKRKPLTETLFSPPPSPPAARFTPPPTPPANDDFRSTLPAARRRMPKRSLGSELAEAAPGAFDVEASSRAHLKESKHLEDSFDELLERLGLPADNDTSNVPQRSGRTSNRRERALQRMINEKENNSRGAPDSKDGSSIPRGFMDILRRTSIEALIELWIILQFIVVMCIFVYTMTKRGPRDVMGMPSKKVR